MGALKVEGTNKPLSSSSSSQSSQQEHADSTGSRTLGLSNLQLFRNRTPMTESDEACLSLVHPLPYRPAYRVNLPYMLESSFPVLMYSVGELVNFGSLMLQSLNHSPTKLSPKNITSLVEAIALGYHSVSYHNFSHAFSLSLVLSSLQSYVTSAFRRSQN